jgi:GH25 family lysozyme M1 (1,4-beta-N-acetylmuramidase)
MTVEGIDVSHHQGTIDWSSVAHAGIKFAYIKASEGESFRDPKYAANVKAATKAGIIVGAYHFAKPSGTPRDAAGEADHFMATAKPAKGHLLPALDLEDGGHDLTAWVFAFCDRVRAKLGRRPTIYVSPAFWEEHVWPAGYFTPFGLWVAHWVKKPRVPRPWDAWTFWQYTDRGRVGSLGGNVDRDRFNGTLDELQSWRLK